MEPAANAGSENAPSEAASSSGKRRRHRRSSILKSTQNILIDLDTNSGGPKEGRRKSRRVSFAETHEVLVFRDAANKPAATVPDSDPPPAADDAGVPSAISSLLTCPLVSQKVTRPAAPQKPNTSTNDASAIFRPDKSRADTRSFLAKLGDGPGTPFSGLSSPEQTVLFPADQADMDLTTCTDTRSFLKTLASDADALLLDTSDPSQYDCMDPNQMFDRTESGEVDMEFTRAQFTPSPDGSDKGIAIMVKNKILLDGDASEYLLRTEAERIVKKDTMGFLKGLGGSENNALSRTVLPNDGMDLTGKFTENLTERVGSTEILAAAMAMSGVGSSSSENVLESSAPAEESMEFTGQIMLPPKVILPEPDKENSEEFVRITLSGENSPDLVHTDAEEARRESAEFAEKVLKKLHEDSFPKSTRLVVSPNTTLTQPEDMEFSGVVNMQAVPKAERTVIQNADMELTCVVDPRKIKLTSPDKTSIESTDMDITRFAAKVEPEFTKSWRPRKVSTRHMEKTMVQTTDMEFTGVFDGKKQQTLPVISDSEITGGSENQRSYPGCANKTVVRTSDMEFTCVLPPVKLTENTDKTVVQDVGMDFTCISNESMSNGPNSADVVANVEEDLNNSITMEFTCAYPCQHNHHHGGHVDSSNHSTKHVENKFSAGKTKIFKLDDNDELELTCVGAYGAVDAKWDQNGQNAVEKTRCFATDMDLTQTMSPNNAANPFNGSDTGQLPSFEDAIKERALANVPPSACEQDMKVRVITVSPRCSPKGKPTVVVRQETVLKTSSLAPQNRFRKSLIRLAQVEDTSAQVEAKKARIEEPTIELSMASPLAGSTKIHASVPAYEASMSCSPIAGGGVESLHVPTSSQDLRTPDVGAGLTIDTPLSENVFLSPTQAAEAAGAMDEMVQELDENREPEEQYIESVVGSTQSVCENGRGLMESGRGQDVTTSGLNDTSKWFSNSTRSERFSRSRMSRIQASMSLLQQDFTLDDARANRCSRSSIDQSRTLMTDQSQYGSTIGVGVTSGFVSRLMAGSETLAEDDEDSNEASGLPPVPQVLPEEVVPAQGPSLPTPGSESEFKHEVTASQGRRPKLDRQLAEPEAPSTYPTEDTTASPMDVEVDCSGVLVKISTELPVELPSDVPVNAHAEDLVDELGIDADQEISLVDADYETLTHSIISSLDTRSPDKNNENDIHRMALASAEHMIDAFDKSAVEPLAVETTDILVRKEASAVAMATNACVADESMIQAGCPDVAMETGITSAQISAENIDISNPEMADLETLSAVAVATGKYQSVAMETAESGIVEKGTERTFVSESRPRVISRLSSPPRIPKLDQQWLEEEKNQLRNRVDNALRRLALDWADLVPSIEAELRHRQMDDSCFRVTDEDLIRWTEIIDQSTHARREELSRRQEKRSEQAEEPVFDVDATNKAVIERNADGKKWSRLVDAYHKHLGVKPFEPIRWTDDEAVFQIGQTDLELHLKLGDKVPGHVTCDVITHRRITDIDVVWTRAGLDDEVRTFVYRDLLSEVLNDLDDSLYPDTTYLPQVQQWVLETVAPVRRLGSEVLTVACKHKVWLQDNRVCVRFVSFLANTMFDVRVRLNPRTYCRQPLDYTYAHHVGADLRSKVEAAVSQLPCQPGMLLDLVSACELLLDAQPKRNVQPRS